MAQKVGNGSSTNPADIKMDEFLIKNVVKIVFTKNMGYFSQRNDFEYTFDLENEFLIASYKHTKKDARGSIIEHGKYNASNVSSKKFLENLISKSNLLNWTDSMMGPLAYDAAYWDMDIYLKCSEKIGGLDDDSTWSQSICRNKDENPDDKEYLKLRCWGQFYSPMLRTLWGTYLMRYVDNPPKNITVEESLDPWYDLMKDL